MALLDILLAPQAESFVSMLYLIIASSHILASDRDVKMSGMRSSTLRPLACHRLSLELF
jgi:hypothetical protein